MELSLSGLDWQVKGYWPWVPVKEKSMETGQTLHGVTDWIPASVPGGVHYDLWRAGLIENPYFGKNSLNCEWVENRWWMYRTAFPLSFCGGDPAGRRVFLVFKGLDYEASVYFNDTCCGAHKGMYDDFRVDVTKLLQEENKLIVIFADAPKEMGQIGYTSRTSTQKSRFNYKWDFSTRLVNVGFWQDAVLEVEEPLRLEELHLDTDYRDGVGKLFFSGKIAGELLDGNGKTVSDEGPVLQLAVEGPFDRRSDSVRKLPGMIREACCSDGAETICCGDQKERSCGGKTEENRCARENQKQDSPESAPIMQIHRFPLHGRSFSAEIALERPQLWQPNGSGRPFLYRLRAEIFYQNEKCWEQTFFTGIRSLELAANEGAPADALPYTFVVNGEKTWIRGVNLTPLDHLYGNVSRAQYENLVTVLVNEGINLVRVWGGGLIEKEEFYDLCDENGILVWQEFIQSSSGIDNRPCETPEFLALLKTAAAAAVKQKRNHVSLAVYSGGNELMEAPDRPCGCENKNLALLKEIVDTYDGRRAFLPTSASGPREFITKHKGVSHDVHGNWRYEGNPGHYELYGESDSLFHSEFGMDGVASVKSLQKFLPKASLRPTPMSGDPNWQHHGEWWGTYFRDCEMFGLIERTPKELERFVACSQYMQSEGLRFILEADARRAWQNSGTIVWQFNEPWPNASCTSLMDYYGELKSAYYQVKRAYEPCHISLDYRTLTYRKGERTELAVHVSNRGEAVAAQAEVTVRRMDGTILDQVWIGEGSETEDLQLQTNRSLRIGTAAFCVPQESLFTVTVSLYRWESQPDIGSGTIASDRCGIPGDGRSSKIGAAGVWPYREALSDGLRECAERELISENTYLFSTEAQTPFAALWETTGEVQLEKVAVTAPENEDGCRHAEAVLYNTGRRTVLEAGLSLKGEDYLLLGEDNYVTLLPGERRILRFLLVPKAAGVFEERTAEADGEKNPEFVLRWL